MALHLDKDTPRTLAYGAELRRDLKLLEVSEEILEELQQQGLCFKGGSSEEAVLCSATRTFAVKNVETSNLVLLVDPTSNPGPTPGASSRSPTAPTPPGQAPPGLATQIEKNARAASHASVTASAVVKSHLELVHVAPRLQTLDTILANRPIGSREDEEEAAMASAMQVDGGVESEDAATERGITWEELLVAVQASPAELRKALTSRGAVCVDGRWRSIDHGHLSTLLEVLVLTAVEKGWDMRAVPAAEAAHALTPHGFRAELTLHCLRRFSTTTKGESDERVAIAPSAAAEVEEEEQYCMDPDAVCRQFGERLLRETPRWEAQEEFLAAWAAAIPVAEGLECFPRVELLRGEALEDAEGGRGLQRLAATDLPRDAVSRFHALFEVRRRWELPALEPYIAGLAGPGETTEALLLKFARASQQRPSDPVTYSAR